MDQQEPEERIVELERQLAQQKRIAELERELAEATAVARADDPVEQGTVDEFAHRLAHALREERERQRAQFLGKGLPTEQPSGAEVAQLRQALTRAANDAGLSPEQYKAALQRAGLRAGGTIKVGGQIVYQSCDLDDPVYLAPMGRQTALAGGFGGRGQAGRTLVGADRVGAIIGVIGGALGLCVGGAAAVTAMFPSSALWMSALVCSGGYELGYNTSHYSYKPGQSGTSVSFQCVGDSGSYDINPFVIDAIQSLLIALVLCLAVLVVGLIRRRMRASG